MFFDINRFHVLVFITWQFKVFFGAQMLFGIFANYKPKWQCDDSPIGTNCDVYRNCNGSLQYPEVFFKSSAMEFDWICSDKVYVASMFSQAQFFGAFIGAPLFCTLSDAYGRKPMSITTLSIGLSMNFLSAFAPTWQILLSIRFILGMALGGSIVVSTFVMEMLLPSQRMFLRCFFNWGTARSLLTLICMIFPEWRSASMASAVAALPALLMIIFIFPESPTWLHKKGQIKEMQDSEIHMARWAGVEYQPNEHKKIEHVKTLCEMLHTPGLFRRLLILWFMWFTAAICSYTNDLNSNSISGNLFLNQILFGVMITVSKMLLLLLDSLVPSFSRRMLHQGAQSLVCACFLFLTIMNVKGYDGIYLLIINLIGTVCIEYTWDACQLCITESMDTSCRASATGSCSLIARIGAIIGPSLIHVNQIFPGAAYLTICVLGSVNLAVSYFFLIETKGVNLDTVTIGDTREEFSLIEKTEDKPNISEKR